MASVKLSTPLTIPPQAAWDRVTDLASFADWLTIHRKWRGEIPSELAKGTTLSSVISVKGADVAVNWTVTEISAPRKVALKGAGSGGVKIGLRLSAAPDGEGSQIVVEVDLGGAAMFGPIGSVFAKVLRGDLQESIDNFARLYSVA